MSLPTYDTNPNDCPSKTFSYELLESNGNALPTFITLATPFISFGVLSKDKSQSGTYDLKIKATDSVSGLTDESDAFTITMTKGVKATELAFETT